MSLTTTSCLLRQHLRDGCEDFSVGGIQPRLFIANTLEVTSVSPDPSYPNGAIDDITYVAGGKKFYEVTLVNNSGGEDGAIQGAKGAGSLNFATGITFTIAGMAARKIEVARILARGNFIVMYELREENDALTGNNSERRLMLAGWPNGLTIETLTIGSGVAETDRVGGVYRLSGAQTNPGLEIIPDPAVYTGTTPNAKFIELNTEA